QGATERIPAIDDWTNAQIGIDFPHHEVHEENHYYIEGWVELDTDDTLFVKLVTPDTVVWSHFKWDIGGTGITITTFDEVATGGMTGGSGVTPLNNDRNSSNTSGMVLTSGVTNADSYTTRIGNTKFGTATSPQRAIGGSSGREDEIILKQNTTYLRTFISESDNNYVSFKAFWYEHTNK
ncbi:MAG: hypothetical protein KAS32_10215, partial [Candidatus Peribacteraceae bacterium]|nr:hypothetical protein [Candidatus Peribacteraceae bacterium]